jgi:hypothetical protein
MAAGHWGTRQNSHLTVPARACERPCARTKEMSDETLNFATQRVCERACLRERDLSGGGLVEVSGDTVKRVGGASQMCTYTHAYHANACTHTCACHVCVQA